MLVGLPERAASGLCVPVSLRLSVVALVPRSGRGLDGTPSLPGTLVGESAHFRLFVDPDVDTQLSFLLTLQGSAGLDALETDWADKQTMLKMPEGQRKIDYHLLTAMQRSTSGCRQ